MVEPGTGDVKAIAQSRPMGRDKARGETYLNYVVPQQYGHSAGFQAGSTFKAFVLASAIKQGIPLSTTINAPPEIALNMGDFPDCDGHYPSTQIWDVHNSTDSGTFNLYTGTQLSVNTFYAQLEQRTGLCEPYNLAKEMGIQLSDPNTERVPAFTLGVPSTSPLEMAEAYATFAGRGLHCDARPVTSIQDSNGNMLKEYPSQCQQVIPGPVADAVNDVLRGVLEPGGFGYDAGISLAQPSAGKTGTINDNMAVWFDGYTPNLATSSMIAGANSVGHWISLNGQTLHGAYVASAHGSTTAGPMWGDAMKVIQQWLPDENFVKPSAQDVAGVLTLVPDTGGMSVEQAQQVLKDAGFNPVLGGYRDSPNPLDTVAFTSPAAGSQAGSGDTITIYQSTGHVAPPPQQHTGGGGGGGGGNGGGGGGGGGGGKPGHGPGGGH